VSFAAITLCVASHLAFIIIIIIIIIIISLSIQYGNFWIHPRINGLCERSEENHEQSDAG
jgi:uncharacterized protein YpmB